MDPCHVFCCHVECCSMFILLHLDGYMLYIADRCHIWIACHFQTVTPIPVIFISFKRFHLIFPVENLDFHVEARFIHSFANHAYASHPASRISYNVHVWFVYYVVCFFPVLLLRVGSDIVALWGSIGLRPFVFFLDSFFFLVRSQERWPLPSISPSMFAC